MKRAKIAGLGFYVPDNVVTNDDLSKRVNTTDEWIKERTGIEQRRYIVDLEEDANYKMGAKASRIAMERAGVTAKDIDLIVYATLSADYMFPGSGVLLQRELGCGNVGAIDVRAQCSGFVYGLSIADQYIKTGMYKNILLVGAEIHSMGMDYSDSGRHIAVIFGDGAGAAVIQPTEKEGQGILSTHLHSQGEHAEELATIDPGFSKKDRFTPDMIEPGGSYYPVMNGQFVFKNAVVRFPEVIGEALEANGLELGDIDMLIPHQANLRISQFVQKRLGLPDEKIHHSIMRYGNTTAASIPIGLTEAFEMGKIKEGDLVCLAAFGSGFTWASALIKW
ncbi:beta-ketoacyl-ACP synthase III [Flammeovirgaceae bacterium SG7u.111]|nr:beta-ketoacyl-ACP synthase III [Flammeovirgaceae bacterium SG7u.132]WPO36529.1 beta-ketoacyl-ACP synthase III [Flammeovirgaceae bacterium SG7u.111]